MVARHMASGPRLIGLLAAHFAANDHMRVERLRRLLRSVEGQTHRAPLLVSWSAEDADGDPSGAPGPVTSEAAAVLREFEASGVVRAMPRLRGRHAQFEHYARLEETLRRHVVPDQQPWVFFSDDDDIWHPQRVEEYARAVAERPGDAEVVASRAHISPGLSPRLPVTSTPADVSRLHSEGRLRLTVSDEHPGGGLFGASTGEYFDLAMAFGVFGLFFRRHNRNLWRNPFADIRFRTFGLKWPGGVYRFLPGGGEGASAEAPWMYHYDRPTEPYTTPPGEEDLKYVCDDLPDPERIAGMRQTLDCVLFQLAPTEGPLRITEEDFMERLVGMLVDQGPATVAMALDRCRLHGVEVCGADGRDLARQGV